MKLLQFASVLAMTMLLAFSASATQPTWIVIGDSIQSFAGDGQAKDLDLTLISNERNVVFKNISSPGISLGGTNPFGYNTSTTTAELDQICGYFSYCDGFIVQAGVNDFIQNLPWSQSATTLQTIFTYARAHGKKVMLLDLVWYWNEATPNTQGLTLFNYRGGRSYACAMNSDVCIWAPRPAGLDAPSTTLYWAQEVSAGHQTHPNVAGHRIMADWIESVAAGAGLF